ncbi:MAG: pyridoxal 5'-phosphate synthase glutaminase subunit PdxT [Planctomycetes bacterium]|nr:pyridoxal 5'-phosphate synthase glutaminase subunit PdxT [Planctomycetota bacterium]
MKIGVLALQGDFAAHARVFGAQEVRRARHIDELDALILPGGESTTMLRLSEGTGIEDAVKRLVERGGAVFGTCAGAILLAREVVNPRQHSWDLIDITVERNAYGRQVDSFDDEGRIFIRAPRIRRVGAGVEVLESRRGEPVVVRQGNVCAATYHPELSDPFVHPFARLPVHALQRANE